MTDNELIAEFMAMNRDKRGVSTGIFMRGKVGLWFHTSWDWLMPVIQKIIKIKTGKYSSKGSLDKAYLLDDLQSLDIEKVYKAVVEFIKWYNKEKVEKD